MTKYYVDSNGKFLGGFDGSTPPGGSFEVSTLPPHGSFKYISGSWEAPSDYYKVQRIKAYDSSGCSLDNLTVALWEAKVENRTGSMDTIQTIREGIKAQYPKPS